MTEQLDNQDDLAAGIFSDVEYVAPQTEPKEFKPWHKPRKQFVRREQLSALLRGLYEKRKPGDPLCYLGLPGTDLIDLRYLHEQLCYASGRQLRFLEFNTEAQRGNPAHVQLNVSLDEVRQLANVDPQSAVIHDDFRRIGNSKSVAWHRTRQFAPFDVVNIDLCDGLASDPPQSDESVYKALAELVAIQRHNPNPWLLLVSTRIRHGMFDADAEEWLTGLFRENVANCEGFAEVCKELLESNVESIDPATCNDTDLLVLMTAAIGKWLSALVRAQGPSRIELASTHAYRVNPVAVREDLVSLALRVEPVIVASRDPLSPTPPTLEDECTTAKAILRRLARRLDVDTLLKQRPDVYEGLVRETERLLADARYEVADYRQWLTS